MYFHCLAISLRGCIEVLFWWEFCLRKIQDHNLSIEVFVDNKTELNPIPILSYVNEKVSLLVRYAVTPTIGPNIDEILYVRGYFLHIT